MSPDRPHYIFGACRVDARRREIFLHGRPVAVQPKVFDLLLFLIENRERAVSKDELQDAIWPRTIVTEASLTRCVMKARRAVDDDPQRPRIIKTVRGHGYRFVADLSEEKAPRSARPRSNEPSVAILPFADLSRAGDQQYFCDGIAEELINALSRLDGLDVAGRSSTFNLHEADLFEIGERLDVGFVLDGSLRKQRDELSLHLHLVDTATGYQVWSEKYRRTLDDVFAVQEDIAEKVARAVAPQLSTGTLLKVPVRTEFAAYDYYLRGLQYTHWFTERGHLLAIEMFEKALGVDPAFVSARTGIAISNALIYQWFNDQPRFRDAAMEHSQRAIEAQPESPQAFLARGVAQSVARDSQGPRRRLRRLAGSGAIRPTT